MKTAKMTSIVMLVIESHHASWDIVHDVQIYSSNPAKYRDPMPNLGRQLKYFSTGIIEQAYRDNQSLP